MWLWRKNVEGSDAEIRAVPECLIGQRLNSKSWEDTVFEEESESVGLRNQSEGDVRPGFDKTCAIEEFPVPTRVRIVREFLGLAYYFRRFVKEFSILAEQLIRLTKKDVEFQWEIDK